MKFFEWLAEFIFPVYKIEEYDEFADFGIYYVSLRGKRVMEFENLDDAKHYCDMINNLHFGVKL